MNQISLLKQAPLEVAQLLSTNNILCGLLVDDTKEPQPQSVSVKQLISEKYLNIFSPLLNASIKDYTRNSSISIVLDEIDLEEENANTKATFYIYVLVDNAHIELANYKNRLLDMIDEILTTLDGKKLSASGAIQISSVVFIPVDESTSGYRLYCSLTDQTSGKAEI